MTDPTPLIGLDIGYVLNNNMFHVLTSLGKPNDSLFTLQNRK